MNENEEEILDKIEEGHRRGEHYTRMAGCSSCTEQFGVGAEPSFEAAGEVRMSGGVHETGLGEYEDAGPPPPDELARRRAETAAGQPTTRPSSGDVEKTLGEVALEDAQQALDDLLSVARQGVALQTTQKAIVHALVGVVRALAGIEEAIYALAEIEVDPGPSLRIVETPTPEAPEDEPPGGEAA